MSVSRKMLKGMGLSEEQQDTILEAHGEQAEGLKSQLAAAQAEAGRLAELQKQLEAAQTELETAKQDGWKGKHDSLQAEFVPCQDSKGIAGMYDLIGGKFYESAFDAFTPGPAV